MAVYMLNTPSFIGNKFCVTMFCGLDDFPQHLFGPLEVGAIGHRGYYIQTDDGLFSVVDEALGGQLAVGDDDGAAVEGTHDGVEDTYLFDVAFVLPTLDVVVNLEGLHEQDDDAAGEVLQGALQGHADGQTHGAEEGDEGGGLDADDIHRHNDDHGFEQHIDQ